MGRRGARCHRATIHRISNSDDKRASSIKGKWQIGRLTPVFPVIDGCPSLRTRPVAGPHRTRPIVAQRTYVRPRCNNTRRVHGVAWSGVEWRGDTVVCEVAHAYACSQHLLLQDGRSRHYVGDVTIHMCRPRGTRVPVLPPSLPSSLSFVVHHPRVDSRFFSFRFILLFCCVDKCREEME